ncbi:MAG: HAMP domain-containing protein, partial [Cellvibrionales bacterium]|nr:HAMP domain-containing protein [Cellvibrionales bacterium]
MENNNPEQQKRESDSREGSLTDRRGEEFNTRSGQRRGRNQSQRPERRHERRSKPQLEPIGAPSIRFPIELKVSAYFLLPLLFGMIVLAYIMIDAHRNFQQKQMDQFARVITAQVAASAIEPLFADAKMELAVLINQVALDNNFIGSGIFNHRGEAIAVSGIMPSRTAKDLRKNKSLFPAEQFQTQASTISKHISKFDYGVVYSHPIMFRGATGGFAVTVFNESSLMGHFEQMAYTLFTTTAALCLLLTTIIFFMSRHVTAPLKYIANVAANIHNGDLTHIPERRNDELGQLIQSLNRMSKDLARKS